jgi:hypothetical protein
MSPWALAVMGEYYTIRVEQSSHFTSFIYNEQVRVFKSSDVESFYRKGMSSIRDGFCEAVESRYRPDFRRSIQLPHEKRLFDDIEHWLDSDSLNVLLSGEIPAGIGPDDARITRDALLAARGDTGGGADGIVYLVVSSDKRMIHSVQQVVAHEHPNVNVRIVGMNVIEFIAYCTGVYPQPGYRDRLDPVWIRNMRIYNPYLKENQRISGPLLGALRTEARVTWSCTQVACRVFYDYPNINRNLKRFTRDPATGLVQEWTGGYLTRARARMDKSIPSAEIKDIRGLNDFSYMQKRLIAPINNRSARLYSAKQGRSIESHFRIE